MITSGAGGEEEARSAAVREAYQVVKALSAGSLMLVLCKSSFLCLGSAGLLMDPGASPSMHLTGRRQGMTQPGGRLPLDHESIWLIEQHPTPYQASLLPDFLTHFTILGLAEIKPHTIILARRTASSRLRVTGLCRWTSD